GIIAEIDADKDVTLEEVDAAKDAKVVEDADVHGRLEESQAQVYHIDLEHADKVLSMQDDEPEPTELKEVIEVVTIDKLMTKVVTAAATTLSATLITAATITAAPSAARRRKGVVIRDPEEIATPSTIQAQIEQDKAYTRELKAELNKNINWDDVIEQYFNSNVAFLEKSEKELEEEPSRELKRKSESSKDKAVENFGVDAVEDFNEYTLRDYYCWLKTYCCWYKLKMLDNAADSRLRLLEQSAAVADKMKK
nr:hypothetical protein [Tanacetum cinerariifolium]